jgi:hypothetical protein
LEFNKYMIDSFYTGCKKYTLKYAAAEKLMATLPATGSAISFGQVNRGFTNNAPGAAGNAPSGGQNIKLSAVLGNNGTYGIGQTAGTLIKFSATFGGKTTPYS